MGGDADRCNTAGDKVVGAGTANGGTGVPCVATLVSGHRDEAIPNLRVAGGGIRRALSLAILEAGEALPCAHTKREMEAHTDDEAQQEIPDQSWSEEVGVDENGCGGNDVGCGDDDDDDDDKATGVAGDVHYPSCTNGSNASFPAMLASGGNDRGTANGHNRRVNAKNDTDRPWAT